LLPKQGIDLEKWAVVACDQYTSEPQYWEHVESFIGESPSTFHMIYPEVFLGKREDKIPILKQVMQQYMEKGTLVECVNSGFVLVSRWVTGKNRLGLLGTIDLETYDYKPGLDTPIRATEETIESRIPPRMEVRKGARLELPHIMLLLDDPKHSLLEPLYARKEELPLLYDTDLMQGGGHVTGYAIVGEGANRLESKMYEMQRGTEELFMAVGDGNHSLATAKAYWNNIKGHLSPKEQQDHLARYALVELVNLHDDAIAFEPIHRVLFHYFLPNLIKEFDAYLGEREMSLEPGDEITFLQGMQKISVKIKGLGSHLPLAVLQPFLDEVIRTNSEATIDYIHGENVVRELCKKGENCGILLQGIRKERLFPGIVADGVLPRKTFSMGEAYEKRYYMECRSIV